MIYFATEFPIQKISSRADFLEKVISWLQGMKHSNIFNAPNTDLERDNAHVKSASGEELRFRELTSGDVVEAIGFRHDYPDLDGRLWRTEAVLRTGRTQSNQDLIRLRTQCLAREPGAKLELPRKPYLIKSLIQDHWGGKDGELTVSDRPIILSDNKEDQELALNITLGLATHNLPTIYISSLGTKKWLISKDKINKLSYDLGGVAHVVVEPSRAFSFILRGNAAGANAYGGTIAIILPGRGIVRRFHTGLRLENADALVAAVGNAVIAIRSEMPANGWDWTELQEEALRRQRERDRNKLKPEENLILFEEEIENLQDRIRELTDQINTRSAEKVTENEEDSSVAFLTAKIGPEIYEGEYHDRIRLAAKECLEKSEQIGLDTRSKLVMETIAKHQPASPALSELLEDLRRATKDPNRLATEVSRLLLRHGYKEKSENKHVRLEAAIGYQGLESITLAKTPSEGRGLTNTRKQIERKLGLTKLITDSNKEENN